VDFICSSSTILELVDDEIVLELVDDEIVEDEI